MRANRVSRGSSPTYLFVRRAAASVADAAPRALLPSPPTIRDLLHEATGETHERLHRHDGLAAVAAGTIGPEAYRSLLCRLYGFHQPFEIAARIDQERTRWLEADLAAFGVDAAALAGLLRCAAFSVPASPDYLLGARYVVEGSALGGRGLARQLDRLLGCGTAAGRRFFSGHGSETGTVWRSYLARLAAAPTAAASREAIITGATATFAIFEQWLDGWNDQHG